MKAQSLLATFGLVVGLTSAGLSEKEARLALTAMPMQGGYPLTVRFQAVLMDADKHNPDLYCLDADWDFDHIRFFDRRDCPPFEEGTETEIDYSTTHTFDEPGTYRVRLSLRRGDELVLRSDVWIRVLSVQDEDNTHSAAVDIMNVPVRAEVSELLRSPGDYEFRTVIVRGKLDSLSSLDEYVIRDRRWWEQSVLVVFRGLPPAGVPVGDEVELKGLFRTNSSAGLADDSRSFEPSRNVYILARSVDSLEYDLRPSDLEPSSELAPPKPVAPRVPSGPPPELVFTLPLDEEQGIDLDTEFRLQFSEDMDASSFEGNVALRYVDDEGLEPDVELDYDFPSRTLTVRSAPLRPAQTVKLILFEGIVDENGVPLASTLTSRRAALDVRSGREKILTLTFYTRQP